MATIYVDIFRAVPGVLVIIALGIGIPALRIEGVPKDEFFWAIVVLTLVYSAYVSEVYRAGIESVHASQSAAARSLGLSQLQTMRHVVVPQAVRRVIPPLLNDFIGLQKDTVLVSFIGVVEIFRQTQILTAANFNFTPVRRHGARLPRGHDPARPVHGLARHPRAAQGPGRWRGIAAADSGKRSRLRA